ncbi:MAG: PRD domain-containing protein, partial [Firmicutes bacterium]|nr:PRD domain-containing protein [Bacillota bacterium]
GLALHLDLARERWKRGESFAEPELDLYRSRDPRVFETVGRYLQGLAREVGAKIDENEVVPVLRYLFYQRKEAGQLEENDAGGGT